MDGPFRAKNIDGLISNHAPDIVLFDVPAPLQYRGADAYRNDWERWLPTLDGPIGCEISDLNITAGDRRGLLALPEPDHQQENRR